VCKFGELQALGVGTERIEQTLHTLFTDKTVVRLDRDTTQDKGSLTLYLQQIAEGKADIILGTQMLAKGHHFPNVTLVAIIDIDSALFSIDFRASEKLAQLIVQVSGRAGRAGFPGKVLLQTRHPDHPLLQTLLSGAYPAFAEAALNERRLALLPPYSHQALFRAQADSLQTAQQLLQEIADLIKQYDQHNIQLLGPVSAPMSKRIGSYHAQLLLQSVSRKNLHHLLDQVLPLAKALKKRKKLKWSLDIDPVDLY